MRNPWADLPDEPPWVLPIDRDAVRRATGRVGLRADLLPEPFVGDPDAPVVVLMKAPGVGPGDDLAAHGRPAFQALVRRSHQATSGAFHPLEPAAAGTPSSAWWRRVLGPLIAVVGEEAVRTGIFVAQALPYHATAVPPASVPMPSQGFTDHLVRRAVLAGATVVVVNGGRAWSRTLGDEALVGAIRPRGPQVSHLSPGNLGPEGFGAVVAALRGDLAPGSTMSEARWREGRRIQVVLDRWERSGAARAACIEVFGSRCFVCDLDMGERYGTIGEGRIHVHHLSPLSAHEDEHWVDPAQHLRPVCPNCHAMLHTRRPPLSIEELQSALIPPP